MSMIVQKFGGTSVADPEKIQAAARRAIRAQQEGHQVLMVVSAMGKNTDMLVDLANQVCDAPAAREMDMLLSTGEQVSCALMAMAIQQLGGKAVSMTGGQIGIQTDSFHGKARIQSISTDRMKKHLAEGKVVIAAGFQGIDEELNITTLGRGGSDTTAVALAAVLDADLCEIYTDVDGVFTTDPRLLPEARKMGQVSYDEMLELASLGAGVMHSRSIEFGKKFNVPIHVRNSMSFSDEPGTIIGPFSEAAERPVGGAALTKNEARVSILGVPDKPGTSLEIFSLLANLNIVVDMVVQNVGKEGLADISFTLLEEDLGNALTAINGLTDLLGPVKITTDKNISKVSIVGLGMATQSGVADRMFRALAEASINIQAITTSEIKVSVLVARDQGIAALRAVHSEFELSKSPSMRASFGETVAAANRANPMEVVARLQYMEDLTIEDLTLNDSQALVTLTKVKDAPGISATIFEAIASHDVLVDMIVQSIGQDGTTNLSFTVPKKDLSKSVEVVTKIIQDVGGGEVSHHEAIDILSVIGVGIRSHTGVAIRMFKALNIAGINVDLINTSEVRVNVVVKTGSGQAGLDAMQNAFKDVLR